MESTDLSSSSSSEPGTGVPYTLLLVCSAGLSRSQVSVDFSPSYDRKSHPNPKLEESIDEVWKQRILVNRSLFNATKFRYGGFQILLLGGDTIQEASICLCLGLTDYSPNIELISKIEDVACFDFSWRMQCFGINLIYGTFVGTNLSPIWEQYLVLVEDDIERCQHTSSPLGNGAVVETIDNFVLVLQRSYNVGEFPGHFVFPGGHSEPQEIGVSGHIYDENKTFRENLNSKIAQEMFDGITREVVEEIGVPASSLSDPIFIGISRRVMNARPTAFFYIKCNLSSLDVQRLYSKAKDGYESTQLCIMSKSDVETTTSKMPGCHQGGFALYDLMTKMTKDC